MKSFEIQTVTNPLKHILNYLPNPLIVYHKHLMKKQPKYIINYCLNLIFVYLNQVK